MPAAHNATQSESRLSALADTGLLDTPPELAFDRLTRLATTVLRVPIAIISLVDRDRQYFKSACGLPPPIANIRETPLSHSFCQYVVQRTSPLVVDDARHDPLLKDNLAIPELGVIAYAGVPIFDQNGEVLGALGAIDTTPHQWSLDDIELLTSIAAQVTHEIQLRQQSLHLARTLAHERQLQTERQMMTRLNVHDLRTPLTAMLLGMDVIGRLGPLSDMQAEYLSLARRNGDQLLNIVNNILDIATIEHLGNSALRYRDCDGNAIAAGALQQVRPVAEAKQISLSIDASAGSLPINADADKIVRVLVNLLGNAVKFTQDRGDINLAVATTQIDGNAQVQYCIRDNGIGIDCAADIFAEGVVMDASADSQRSTGLGLTFCKRIVEAHGGRIWFESALSQGSTFYFTLPISPTHAR